MTNDCNIEFISTLGVLCCDAWFIVSTFYDFLKSGLKVINNYTSNPHTTWFFSITSYIVFPSMHSPSIFVQGSCLETLVCSINAHVFSWKDLDWLNLFLHILFSYYPWLFKLHFCKGIQIMNNWILLSIEETSAYSTVDWWLFSCVHALRTIQSIIDFSAYGENGWSHEQMCFKKFIKI